MKVSILARLGLALLLLHVTACYASHDSIAPDGSSRDGVRDSGLHDSGLHDSGVDSARPDAGLGCIRDEDCPAVCVRDEAPAVADDARLPLVCGPASAARDDGSFCELPGDCGRGLCVVAGSCVAPCAADAECGSGRRCARVWVRTSSTTMQWLNGCVDRTHAPPDVLVSRVRAGVARGEATPDALHLPGAAGTQVLVVQSQEPQFLYASRFSTADSPPILLFDADGYTGAGPPPRAPFYGIDRQLSILMPSGPRARTSMAGYTLSLYSDSRSPVFVTSLSRVGVGHMLDLDIFYAGAAGIGPMGRRGPPRIADAVGTMERLYATFGIRIGRVRQHLLVGQRRREYAIIESTIDGELPQMPELLKLSAGAARSSVSIFLVSDIDGALGVAGGVPGPEAMNGTTTSGVLIAVDVHTPGIDDLGSTVAHEVGHYLGLFHTTEMDGSFFEPLSDTPRCPPARDIDGDGYVIPDECVSLGGDNLMFWSGTGDVLSPQQGDVLAHAPLLR